MMSHCEFPGAGSAIKLNSMLKVGDYVIGEDYLTYNYQFDEDLKKITEEQVLPNSYNSFFQALSQNPSSKEQDILQLRFKSKIELT